MTIGIFLELMKIFSPKVGFTFIIGLDSYYYILNHLKRGGMELLMVVNCHKTIIGLRCFSKMEENTVAILAF